MTKLEQYYNKFKEDHRLTTRHGMVEFTVSLNKILQVAGENNLTGCRLADIGAGTGRYSVELARRGFDVTAVELVKHNLDILLAKHEKVKCWPGDARDLHFLGDESFDITLVFGPMYHLHSVEDRLKALKEAKRITRKGGFIFVAYYMNEYSIISYCFKKGMIKQCIENKTLTEDFKAVTTEDDLYSFTRLEDADKLKELAELKRIKIFAPDGPADYMRRELNAMDEQTFNYFIEYQLATCERAELLGASSHIVDVLQKV